MVMASEVPETKEKERNWNERVCLAKIGVKERPRKHATMMAERKKLVVES